MINKVNNCDKQSFNGAHNLRLNKQGEKAFKESKNVLQKEAKNHFAVFSDSVYGERICKVFLKSKNIFWSMLEKIDPTTAYRYKSMSHKPYGKSVDKSGSKTLVELVNEAKENLKEHI